MRASLLGRMCGAIAIALVGCGDEASPIIDAAHDAPAIDGAVDAPAIDAPAIDARAIDAPAIDAPAIDAPAIDAPIDAPPPPQILAPQAYLGSADSPFGGLAVFHLEDFEDGILNTPGASADSTTRSSASGVSLIDSVDNDDGLLDGTCQVGCDALFGPGAITFTFDGTVLGGLPTHAGVVWTDGGVGATITSRRGTRAARRWAPPRSPTCPTTTTTAGPPRIACSA